MELPFLLFIAFVFIALMASIGQGERRDRAWGDYAEENDLALLHISYIWVAINIFKVSPSAATDLFGGDTPHR